MYCSCCLDIFRGLLDGHTPTHSCQINSRYYLSLAPPLSLSPRSRASLSSLSRPPAPNRWENIRGIREHYRAENNRQNSTFTDNNFRPSETLVD